MGRKRGARSKSAKGGSSGLGGAVVGIVACIVGFILYAVHGGDDGDILAPDVERSPSRSRTGPKLSSVLEHDTRSFTQGLVIADGYMYESNGMYGASNVRKLDLHGKVLAERGMDKQFFAEGLDYFNGQLIQLTWREKVVFIYDAATLRQVRRVEQPRTVTGEGWGITNNGTHLIVSDGSNTLFFWDAETLQEVGRLEVRHKQLASEFASLYNRLGPNMGLGPDGDKIHFLNELEFVNGEILANVWYSDKVLRISPTTGAVLGVYDFTHLHRMAHTGKEDCLNGIAVDRERERLYVTGKYFGKLFILDL